MLSILPIVMAIMDHGSLSLILKVYALQNLIGLQNNHCNGQKFCDYFYSHPHGNLITDTSKFMCLGCWVLGNNANQDSFAHVKTVCRLWRALKSFCLLVIICTTIFCWIQNPTHIFHSPLTYLGIICEKYVMGSTIDPWAIRVTWGVPCSIDDWLIHPHISLNLKVTIIIPFWWQEYTRKWSYVSHMSIFPSMCGHSQGLHPHFN